MEVRPRAPGAYRLSAWSYQYISHRYSILANTLLAHGCDALALEALQNPYVLYIFLNIRPINLPSIPPLHLSLISSCSRLGCPTEISPRYWSLVELAFISTSIVSAQPRSISPSAAVVVRCRHNRDLLMYMYCGPLFSAQCLPSTSTSPGSWSWVSVLRSK